MSLHWQRETLLEVYLIHLSMFVDCFVRAWIIFGIPQIPWYCYILPTVFLFMYCTLETYCDPCVWQFHESKYRSRWLCCGPEEMEDAIHSCFLHPNPATCSPSPKPPFPLCAVYLTKLPPFQQFGNITGTQKFGNTGCGLYGSFYGSWIKQKGDYVTY